jgi:DNA-binding SARP family transcriptional activator
MVRRAEAFYARDFPWRRRDRTSNVNIDSASQLTICLLSSFELRHGNVPVAVPGPGQRLLALLALRHRGVARRSIAAILWPDHDEVQASARLRSALWRLPMPHRDQLVLSEGGHLRLAPAVEIDIRLAEDDSGGDDDGLMHLHGDVLVDWDEDWVTAERERFRQLRLHRLEQLSERAQGEGRYGFALQAALAAVAVDPLRESAHRQVMLIHLAEQNPSEAIRQYTVVHRLLQDALGLPPSPATRAVVGDLIGRGMRRPPAHPRLPGRASGARAGAG